MRLSGDALAAAGTARLAVAVSGGPDSLALLWLAVEALGAARVVALSVDHALRPGSADEAAGVARAAAGLGVAHATLRWTGPRPRAGLQAAARRARYGLMAEWCRAHGVAWLATAHHADDQAETVLMRAARGAGTAGLSGIRPRRKLGGGVTLIRPLLGWRREELAAIAEATGWPVVRDPGNADPRFARTRARALLAAAPWLAGLRLAAVAEHQRVAEAALAWAAARAWAGRASLLPGPELVLDAAGLPRALQLRLVARALRAIAPAARPRGSELSRLCEALVRGRRATLAGVLADPRAAHDWRFTPAPPRMPRDHAP